MNVCVPRAFQGIPTVGDLPEAIKYMIDKFHKGIVTDRDFFEVMDHCSDKHNLCRSCVYREQCVNLYDYYVENLFYTGTYQNISQVQNQVKKYYTMRSQQRKPGPGRPKKILEVRYTSGTN